MARTSKKNAVVAAVNAAAIESLIDQSMETATHVDAIDHHSQLSSWAAPAAPEAPAEETVTETPIETSPDESVLEQAVQQLEAHEEVQEPEAEAVQGPEAPKSFDDLVAAYAEDVALDVALKTSIALDARGAFETTKNPDNENIHRTLKKVRSHLVTKRAARVLLATNVDPEVLINRSVHDGARYNVYALGKVADIVFGVTNDGVIANAINLACMRSLFACKKAGIAFTMEVAKAACSKQVHIDAAIRQHLVRHTVSPSTAPTQASSTMQALVTLGVVKAEGSSRNPTYTLTDHPIVAKIETVLAKAA
jgi:hypothetical protein